MTFTSTGQFINDNTFISAAGGLRFKPRVGQSDTVWVLPTVRHRCDISSKVTVLPRHNDVEMGPANTLYASA